MTTDYRAAQQSKMADCRAKQTGRPVAEQTATLYAATNPYAVAAAARYLPRCCAMLSTEYGYTESSISAAFGMLWPAWLSYDGTTELEQYCHTDVEMAVADWLQCNG